MRRLEVLLVLGFFLVCVVDSFVASKKRTTTTHWTRSARASTLWPVSVLRTESDGRDSDGGVSGSLTQRMAAADAQVAIDPKKIIDGKAIAAEIRAEVAAGVQSLEASTGIVPGLAVVLVGDRKDSETYVRMKKKACQQVGIRDFGSNFTADVTSEELLQRIQDLNANPEVHGILVQLPLPPHLNEQVMLEAISTKKDVDGLHPVNMAALTTTQTHSNRSSFDWRFEDLDFPVACTPQGCVELLDRCNIPIAGKRAVVIGRSNIVGIPVAMLLMQRDATVTIVHSQTVNPESLVREADIVVAAAGRAEIVKADWVKPGAVVIDVGINSVEDSDEKKGYRLVGDVAFQEVGEKAAKITPVPGGVGPMTIAMLLRNTLQAAKRTADAPISVGLGLENQELLPPLVGAPGASGAPTDHLGRPIGTGV